MIKVYVAGPYSCRARCEYGVDLTAMQRGIDACARLLSLGYAPYCPWLDYQFRLCRHGQFIDRSLFYQMSLAWLEVSDAMFIMDRHISLGVQDEIDFASEKGIPIYYDFEDFIKNNPIE